MKLTELKNQCVKRCRRRRKSYKVTKSKKFAYNSVEKPI